MEKEAVENENIQQAVNPEGFPKTPCGKSIIDRVK